MVAGMYMLNSSVLNATRRRLYNNAIISVEDIKKKIPGNFITGADR